MQRCGLSRNQLYCKESVMTYATAITNPYIAHSNLSTTADHYGTRNNLCSTITDTLEALCNLSTA